MAVDLTRALSEWASGDQSALDRLAPAVYPQLRHLAGYLLSRERAGHTWQATALVSELFLKLIGQGPAQFDNRRHFYNACARLMRQALIDHARGVNRAKRGNGQPMVPLHEEMGWFDAAGPEVIDLDRRLTELASQDPEMVAIFETRYLLGCSAEETAEIFGASKATVDRKVRLARAWLYHRLQGGAPPQDPA
jgi:RNA polymerase sigma factor (TIGR02999 family)